MKIDTTHPAVAVWRVVIIEDSPDDRAEIRRLLLKGSERRYRFVEAETGAAGLRAVLDTLGSQPDCAVLDYSLPDTDALEVLAALVGPGGLTVCPVVVLTGTADARLGPAVLQAGAQDFIGKSWMTAESLTRAVENAAARWAMTRELKARTVALQASEAQLKLGVEVAGLGVYRIDHDKDTVVLDPIAAALFGLAAGVPLPRSVIHSTFHPDDKDEIVGRMHRSLDPTGEGTFSMEHRVVHPDGSVRWLSVKEQVVFAETAGIRRPVTSVLAAVDITDRKVGEEQLRASEQFNRSLMDGSADCVKVLDLDGRLLHMNAPGLCALEIDDLESVCGQEWKAIWPAESSGDIERSVTKAVGGEVSSFQALCPSTRGTPKWWDVTVSPVRDAEGGRVVRLLAVSRDITERKRTEERYRASEGRVRQVIDSMFTFVGMIAPDGTLTEANHAPLEIAGLTRGDVIGKPFWDCYWWNYDPAVQERLRAGFDRAVRGEIVRYDETIRIANDGRAVIDLMLQPVFEGGQLRFVIPSAADITSRKQAEEQLRQLAAELSEADQRKDEFLATLAHELRNPLAPIRTGLYVLRKSQDPTLKLRTQAMMERQLVHMVKLIDDLMDVSRITSGKVILSRERISLRALVESAVEATRSLLEAADHTLHIDLPSEPIWLDVDATRISQVFSNLLTNAAKYSPNQGKISLTARQTGKEVVISVVDEGVGIPADMLDHVFEMFAQVNRTLDRAQGGLGIGLALAKRLVELHGGTIVARSAGMDLGSNFTVSLPAALPVQDVAASNPDGSALPQSHRLRALVVDDNADAAESLAAMLQLMGHETAIANNGPAGLASAKRTAPDVVFLDLGMPGMSGYEVARQLRSVPELEATMLVALTGWGSDEDRRKSTQAGFDRHLIKPTDAEEVEVLLDQLRRSPGRIEPEETSV